MAWNRPSKTKVERKGGGGQRNVHLRGLIAGAIVVVVVAVAAWLLWPSAESQTSNPKPQTSSLIKEVKPAVVVKAEPEKPKDPPGYWNGKKISNENRPPWMSPYHRVVDYGTIHTVKVDQARLPIYEKVFVHGADQQIAEMIMTEPGTFFLGDCKGLYEGFDEIFVESLKDPIIAYATDSDEVKAMKRAVNQVKIDLKARMDAGESLRKIMEENWNAMKELGLYRQELRDEVERISTAGDNVTEADVDDCIAAANKMLEARGCAPLPAPAFLKERIMLKLNARKEGMQTNEEE